MQCLRFVMLFLTLIAGLLKAGDVMVEVTPATEEKKALAIYADTAEVTLNVSTTPDTGEEEEAGETTYAWSIDGDGLVPAEAFGDDATGTAFSVVPSGATAGTYTATVKCTATQNFTGEKAGEPVEKSDQKDITIILYEIDQDIEGPDELLIGDEAGGTYQCTVNPSDDPSDLGYTLDWTAENNYIETSYSPALYTAIYTAQSLNGDDPENTTDKVICTLSIDENPSLWDSAEKEVSVIGGVVQYKYGEMSDFKACPLDPEKLYLPVNVEITFRAKLTSDSCEWPEGKPSWGGIAQGTEETVTKTFTAPSSSVNDPEVLTVDTGEEEEKTVNIVATQIVTNSLTPADELIIGEDLTVNYTINPTDANAFDRVELHVLKSGSEEGSSDTVISKSLCTSTSGANRTKKWEKAKWSETPHSGAYANPKNGPYKVKVVGYFDYIFSESEICESIEKSIATKLKIKATVKDNGGDAAGVDDLDDCLKIVLGKGGTAQTVADSGVDITDITGGKKIETNDQATTLDALDDGEWKIYLKNIRDEIGNFYDHKSSETGVQPYEWTIKLY